jgi:hypothetical protein
MKKTALITQADILRLRHLAGEIHPLGPRVAFELLRELSAESSAVIGVCEAYARIDGRVLDLYGGRELPSNLRVVK